MFPEKTQALLGFQDIYEILQEDILNKVLENSNATDWCIYEVRHYKVVI